MELGRNSVMSGLSEISVIIFRAGNKYAITGGNGSGKSTLLKLISGAVLSNEGTIRYFGKNKENEYESSFIFSKIAWVAPYIELVEEMTLLELFNFYKGFKQITFEHFGVLKRIEFRVC